MGHVHSRAWARIVSLDSECELRPRLVHAADIDERAVDLLKRQWEWDASSTDWRSVVDDPAVEVVDICAPNSMHCEIALAAARAGKHVYCEKPLGRSATEARIMAEAVMEAGVRSCVGYNYRWMPALQHLRDLVEVGRLGTLTHFRSVFHTDWGASPAAPFSWRFDREQAGSGALGDAGSHVIDTAEVIMGPVASVIGMVSTLVEGRPLARGARDARDRAASVFGAAVIDADAQVAPVTNEDYIAALLVFASGARGTMEVSRAINGPRSRFTIEVHGTDGAFSWDLERMNEYELWLRDDFPLEYGYRRVLLGPGHPDQALFSPGAGVGIAFEDSKTIEILHFVQNLSTGQPHQPDFASGLRVAQVTQAVEESVLTGRWSDIAPEADLEFTAV